MKKSFYKQLLIIAAAMLTLLPAVVFAQSCEELEGTCTLPGGKCGGECNGVCLPFAQAECCLAGDNCSWVNGRCCCDGQCGPTVVELSGFEAIPGDREVTLVWLTESEIDNAGFNIYRAMTENGEYEKINSSLIPAEGSPTQGASYEFTDTNVQNRKTYYYKLEDLDFNGQSTMHGPVSATPRWIFWIFGN